RRRTSITSNRFRTQCAVRRNLLKRLTTTITPATTRMTIRTTTRGATITTALLTALNDQSRDVAVTLDFSARMHSFQKSLETRPTD
ncbi:MAG: hypothetical protein HZA46_06710, partial [Planctomycetales bacterium]|nr:hypothetical protein [Planctomycetales bacterium]